MPIGMERKIKIVEFTDDLEIGGIQKVVCDLASGLTGEDFEIHVITLYEKTPGGLDETLPDSVKVHYLPVDHSRTITVADYIRNIGPLSRLLKELGPDVVHAHNSSMSFLFLALALKLSHMSVRTIRTIHFCGFFFTGRTRADRMRRWCDRMAVRLLRPLTIGVSPFVKELMERIYPRIRHEAVFNGVDTENVFNPGKTEVSRYALTGTDGAVPVITYVARLAPMKGHHTLLKAWKRLMEQGYSARLILVGDGELMDETRMLASRLGIEDSVLFTGFRKNVNEYLACSDACVFPSESEGFSLVMLEKIGMGLPVIASDLPVFRLVKKMTGAVEIFETGNEVNLSEKLKLYFDNRDAFRRKGLEGRRIVCSKFSTDSMLARYRDLYRESE